jgi:FlaA1/EpsC-like NDP-sugar epimerase
MSQDNSFFRPTLLHKEFMILDLIEKNPSITQREIASLIGIAVSMVNNYIENFDEQALIKRKKHSSKDVDYIITKKGLERRKLLNIWYLKSSYNVYLLAKDNIIIFLNQIIKKGFKKIILYGAGEVAEIMLQVINSDNQIPLEVVSVIDDSNDKIGSEIVNIPIIPLSDLNKYEHDCIMISSYKHHETIYKKLVYLNYPENNIIHFFDK